MGVVLIDSYSFGRMVIDGKTYTSDVILYTDKVDGSWWRKSGHLLQKEDVVDILDCKPEILIVGTGSDGLMKVPKETKKSIESQDIELIVERTKKACDTYNELNNKRKTVAALHLTC